MSWMTMSLHWIWRKRLSEGKPVPGTGKHLSCHRCQYLGGIQESQQFARYSLIAATQIYAHNLENVRNPCADKVAGMLFSAPPFVRPASENQQDGGRKKRSLEVSIKEGGSGFMKELLEYRYR